MDIGHAEEISTHVNLIVKYKWAKITEDVYFILTNLETLSSRVGTNNQICLKTFMGG